MAQPAQGSGIRLGQVFGIPIYLHPSWFIIFVLVTAFLRAQFTSEHPGWTPAQAWALGIATSVLFFASVIFHELSHSVVALRYQIPVKSITLFMFGGVSSIEKDASSAKQEVTIAVVGPLSSLFLASCFWLVSHYWHDNEMVASASKWLAGINLLLALFNLIPGLPLDGGRILRGIAWGMTGDSTKATRIASNAGRAFSCLIILVGAGEVLYGDWANGLFTAFIGWFLLNAAQESIAQVTIRNTFTGVRAEDIMTKDIPTVPRDISLEEYMQEVLRTGRRCHIVTGAGRPVGLVTLHAVRTVPREEWGSTSIQAAMLPLSAIHSASPDEPALKVLERMQNEDINQMPVISDGQIVGMIARDTILRALQTRLQVGHLAEP